MKPIGFIGTFRNGRCKIYREVDLFIYDCYDEFNDLSVKGQKDFLTESMNQVYNYPVMFKDLSIELIYEINESNRGGIEYIKSLNKVKETCYRRKNL